MKIWKSLNEGFDAIKVLDNVNVYAVLFSENASNIFMSSMWQKVLNPYTLLATGGDKAVVGNMITLSGITRAVVGVFAGRILIDAMGCDSTMAISGVFGIIGMVINVWAMTQESLISIYWLNIVWAIYNGLWNSALETEWARSVAKQKREDANGARQVLNKLSTAMGPVFGIAVFLYLGQEWTVETVGIVMIVGTVLSAFPVLLCFTFSRIYEIRQEAQLSEISRVRLSNYVVIDFNGLVKKDFEEDKEGIIKVTYPVSPSGKYGKIRILTSDLKETKYILGKQVKMSFKKAGADVVKHPVYIDFEDHSRGTTRATLDALTVYLCCRSDSSDRLVSRDVSTMVFHLSPDFNRTSKTKRSLIGQGFRKVLLERSKRNIHLTDQSFEDEDPTHIRAYEPPLPDDQSQRGSVSLPDDQSVRGSVSERVSSKSSAGKGKLTLRSTTEPTGESKIDISIANLIVFCDVLNAVGSGMSLKFIDLFLIEDYEVSPVELLSIAIIQNLAIVWLTPTFKEMMKYLRKEKGLSGSVCVSIVWGISLIFLALICIPRQNFIIVVISVVLMNSLTSCTKAYNKAKLINSLPHNRVANYMVWDSLNKANQGGIAIFGGLICARYGYRGCFLCTWVIMFVRWLVWTLSYFNRRSKSKATRVATAEQYYEQKLESIAEKLEVEEEFEKADGIADVRDAGYPALFQRSFSRTAFQKSLEVNEEGEETDNPLQPIAEAFECAEDITSHVSGPVMSRVSSTFTES